MFVSINGKYINSIHKVVCIFSNIIIAHNSYNPYKSHHISKFGLVAVSKEEEKCVRKLTTLSLQLS